METDGADREAVRRQERQVKVGANMPDQDERQEEREQEVQEELAGEEEDVLLRFSRYSEARATLPWSQRTFKEKLAHHADRIFLFFLALFLLVFAGEAAYKMWYVTNWKKVYKFVLDLVSYLISEEEKELNEL